MELNKKRLLDTLCEMIRIDSVSLHEKEMADWIETYFKNRGFDVYRDEAGKNFGSNGGNLLIHVPGTMEGEALCFNAHIDTVSPGNGIEPVVDGEFLVSKGDTILAADDKSGIAAFLARPFITHHNTLDMDMYLRIETELYLKRLIVGGFERVYEVGRIFRNEDMDTKHNPEFTSIELYQAYTDYKGMMALVEEMNEMLARKICGSPVITYQGTQIDMSKWERLTMVEAVKKYSGCDYYDWKTDEDARACAKEKHVEVPADATKGAVLVEFFDAFVEENLIQPTIIYDYPVENSPLAKRKPEEPAFTERFEYFICAREMGNAFSELNDPIDQKERFERQVAAKKAQEPGSNPQVDEDYVTALEYGLAPTGGLGFGLDRLVMLLTDSASIRDVLLFPTMRPKD